VKPASVGRKTHSLSDIKAFSSCAAVCACCKSCGKIARKRRRNGEGFWGGATVFECPPATTPPAAASAHSRSPATPTAAPAHSQPTNERGERTGVARSPRVGIKLDALRQARLRRDHIE
jgi:hypothetical protein